MIAIKRSLLIVVLALTAVVTRPFGQTAALDYPQWRGVNRDGGASAFAEPSAWPEHLTRKWSVTVGEGYATPVVVADVVYAFTRRERSEVLTALEAETARERWRTGYAAPYLPSSPAAAHGAGPKATPLFYNGKVYTLGISGAVSAFDANNGRIVWHIPAAADSPFYGTAVSPLGDDGLIIVHPGNYGPLTAFDANTGNVRWTVSGNGTFASPIIADFGGIRQVVTMTQEHVIGVSLATGVLLWQYPWVSRMTPSAITPVLHGNIVIVGGQGMGVTALKPTRQDDTWTVNVVWETKEVSLFLSNPVVIGDVLFGLSERASGQFFAVDARTGKALWLGPPRQATNTAVAKAGDVLLLLNDDGELIVAKNSRTAFEPLARYRVADSATWAQPAISGHRIFVKDVSSLTLWTID